MDYIKIWKHLFIKTLREWEGKLQSRRRHSQYTQMKKSHIQSKERTSDPTEDWTKHLNKPFDIEDMHVANEQVKRYATSLVSWKMQIKTLRSPYTSPRTTRINKKNTVMCWQRRGAPGMLTDFWGNAEWCSHLGDLLNPTASIKAEQAPALQPRDSTPRHTPNRMAYIYSPETCTRRFAATALVRAPNSKLLQCSSPVS